MKNGKHMMSDKEMAETGKKVMGKNGKKKGKKFNAVAFARAKKEYFKT